MTESAFKEALEEILEENEARKTYFQGIPLGR
jgi:hypothetical protein